MSVSTTMARDGRGPLRTEATTPPTDGIREADAAGDAVTPLIPPEADGDADEALPPQENRVSAIVMRSAPARPPDRMLVM